MKNKCHTPKLSIIVPIYNVERYLPKCLESIIVQEFDDFEVIAVNDGSTDECGKILDEYASTDTRIKPIHIENSGVSNARNIGLDIAKGQYIGFVDGDDYIAPDMYKNLILEAEKDSSLDFLQCRYEAFSQYDEILESCEEKEPIIIEKPNIIYEFFLCERLYNSVWSKIFKREMLLDLKFNTEYSIGEDGLFVFECCRRASKIKILQNVGYYYYQREDSAMHKKTSEKNFDVLKIMDIYKCYYDKKDSFYFLMVRNDVIASINMLVGIIKDNVFNDRFESIRKRLLKNKWQVFFGRQYHWKVKVITFLLWISPDTCRRIYGQGKRTK